MEKDEKIFAAGHEGMIGSAILRCLKESGFMKLLTKTSTELDLTNQKKVYDFFMDEKPDYVFLAPAKVGGILANSRYPAEFIYNNIQAQTNVIHSAWKARVKKLLFLASSCIYPKVCPQPMREDYLLTGSLEPTSEPYAIAKIAGIKMCQSYNRQYGTNFISLVSTNLYGAADDFDPETSHLVPGLITKFHEAKISGRSSVTLWGTGTPRREFMHVDDLSAAGVFLMKNYNGSEIINVGVGKDMSVKELAELITKIVNFEGEILFDHTKPDGAPRKLLDSSKIKKMGWTPKISLEEGIRRTYNWYKEQVATKNLM